VLRLEKKVSGTGDDIPTDYAPEIAPPSVGRGVTGDAHSVSTVMSSSR
jgi:hypothetical protein